MVNCPNCGSDVGENKFCHNCGTKIGEDKPKSFCPNCGNDVGDSIFCPNCGTKIGEDKPKSFCPNCGNDVGENKFCPNCGTKINTDDVNGHETNDIVENLINTSDNLSNRLSSRLKKSKSVDSLFEKTSSQTFGIQKKTLNNSVNRAYWENIDPNFFVVYDRIDDEELQILFWLERSNLGSGVIVSPTMGLSDEEAIKFYENLLDNLIDEINQEKQNGTFDIEEFHQRKMKEATVENISSVGIPKVFKTMHKLNKK
ncbi:zinc ribbon domain-containing protein [uncultured Methanobrevibacter sp.]|uniref:zinc ribbon domain-containing protein n=1 Tax=uncultured Methanobrevibacter sp. TaxID=253161 RepID=UPI0025FF7634|nr:zinc ribbon domain-containing protein [uncultured Methanobrevibacter sp.]